MPTKPTVISIDAIARNILFVRNHKVLLDSELAALYQVETKALTRAVRRNVDRFPDDFMFQLTVEESDTLRRQIGTSSWGRPTISSLRIHGARGCNAFLGTKKR